MDDQVKIHNKVTILPPGTDSWSTKHDDLDEDLWDSDSWSTKYSHWKVCPDKHYDLDEDLWDLDSDTDSW